MTAVASSRRALPQRAGRAAGRGIRKLTGAQGAAESGLAKLVELGAVNAMGDTIITIALANTLFFAVPSGQARGRVAIYLLVTMVPFVFVAPVIGRSLDRFRTGRRWAMGLEMALRGFLCWVMADAIQHGGWELYPAAFVCLTGSKAYIITRASTLPRLLPERLTLVSANSRVSLAGSAGGAAAGIVGGSLAFLGHNPAWALRVDFLVFAIGTVLCGCCRRGRTPPRASRTCRCCPTRRSVRPGRKLRAVAPQVDLALRANAGLRVCSGFLLIFGAFLIREHPFHGIPAIASAALVGGAAALGGFAGTGLGTLVGTRRPQALVRVAPILVGAASLVAALWYTPVTLAVVRFCAGLAQQLGKLSLDALIQRDVPDRNRSGCSPCPRPSSSSRGSSGAPSGSCCRCGRTSGWRSSRWWWSCRWWPSRSDGRRSRHRSVPTTRTRRPARRGPRRRRPRRRRPPPPRPGPYDRSADDRGPLRPAVRRRAVRPLDPR